MPWARSEKWLEIFGILDDWWQEAVTSTLELIEDSRPERLSPGFGNWTIKLVRWCYSETTIDPAPLWMLAQSLHAALNRRVGGTPPLATPREYQRLLDAAQLVWERIHWEGTVYEKPGDPEPAGAAGSEPLVRPQSPALVPMNAIIDKLSQTELIVYETVANSDIRLTQELVMATIENNPAGEVSRGVVNASLAWFCKVGLISSRSISRPDERGHGYGRAEWGGD